MFMLSCTEITKLAHTIRFTTKGPIVLFSIFIDDSVKLVSKTNRPIGCRIGARCSAIFLYADDVIMLAPSVCMHCSRW